MPEAGLIPYVLNAYGQQSGEALIEACRANAARYNTDVRLLIALDFATRYPEQAASVAKLA
jgi:hypothetical protein